MSEILQQQIEYYRARASEYDEWFYRVGRYDRGDELNRQWFEEIEVVRDALFQLPKTGHALELACGTGIWTQELIKIADKVTALDASPEMIELNKAKVQSDRVEYVQTDLFTWEADARYDLVFMGFWLSHVPPESLEAFLQKVRNSLNNNGRLFIVDSRKVVTSTARDHVIPEDSETLKRKLNDGREYQIFKIFYEPEKLQKQLQKLGFDAEVKVTPNYFIYVNGIGQ